ncbi:DUF3099 domain-containing protein [Devriesea agamarum]|uniref:DUF3099 domain-containing protein n=1 Tax=Devriesea agamarum TaxID=472569 RepID=UPI00071C7955|nr:DUF3099 domain-containing protein [Devriesea agamarum]
MTDQGPDPEPPTPLSADIARRQKVYIVRMVIRMVCFLLVIVAPGWWKAVFAVAAAVLPYIAVVGANRTRPVRTRQADSFQRELTSTWSNVTANTGKEPAPMIQGQVISSDDARSASAPRAALTAHPSSSSQHEVLPHLDRQDPDRSSSDHHD